MLSKVTDTITGVFTPLSVVFLCCLYLFCENIRKENGVTQLMRHNRFSDCCVALHSSAGISSEVNGNVRCYGGLLDLQHAVTCEFTTTVKLHFQEEIRGDFRGAATRKCKHQ